MKFLHLADSHLGSWKEERMQKLTLQAFEQAIQQALDEHVDFVLIAGDLFDTAMPGIEVIRVVVRSLEQLRKASIPVYGIQGSHDCSPSGKTILSILEEAGLFINVEKDEQGSLFTQDPKTQCFLTGIGGRTNMLDAKAYEQLDTQAIAQTPGEKIFLFHTALSELKPNELNMSSFSMSKLPPSCRYYAGGHLHIRKQVQQEGSWIVYPGPTFPTNIQELRDLQHGSCCLVTNGIPEIKALPLKEVVALTLDAEGKSVEEVQQELQAKSVLDVEDKIVVLHLSGMLASGRPSDLPLKELTKHWYEKGAYAVVRSTSQLHMKSFEGMDIQQGSVEEMEGQLMQEHLGQYPFEGDEAAFTKELMAALAEEQKEGETKTAFEQRVLENAQAMMKKHGLLQ